MKKYLLWLWALFCGAAVYAHPMPSSLVELSVLQNVIRGEAKIPLIELGNAVGAARVTNMATPFFKTYFTAHIKARSSGENWNTQIESISLISDTDPVIGSYQEVLVRFTLTPPDARGLRRFTFNYDAIMHQVVTHSALVYVRQDWDNGIQSESGAQQIGIIKLDVRSEKIFPLQVNLEKGSCWKGAKSMFRLGIQHIKEGTDHLLFLLVLLLPAMLLTNGKQWGRFGGVRYSLSHLVTIVTAFTVGHSITLLVGALGWVPLPGQPVEILIAVSILVSAVHAIKPIFPGKEMGIAAGFGLIHGLAFATVLSSLELSGGRLALSIVSFNLGIEVAQLFIIILVVPWLMLLSKTPAYKWLRTTGALLAGIAALAWIVERTSGKANLVTGFVEAASQYGVWCIAAFTGFSLLIYLASGFAGRKTKLVS